MAREGHVLEEVGEKHAAERPLRIIVADELGQLRGAILKMVYLIAGTTCHIRSPYQSQYVNGSFHSSVHCSV